MSSRVPSAAFLGSLVSSLDLGPSRLDEPAVTHARWACGLARETAQTHIQMLYERASHRYLPLGSGLHEIYPPPRGVELVSGLLIRGARGEAKAAVDAVFYELGARFVRLVESVVPSLLHTNRTYFAAY